MKIFFIENVGLRGADVIHDLYHAQERSEFMIVGVVSSNVRVR